MKDNLKFWNRNARLYRKMQRNDQKREAFFQTLEKKIVSFLNKDMKVLELAMGPAILTKAIANSCKYLIATDYSEEMIKEAKKCDLPENVMIEQCDCTNMKYDDNSFDAICIANCLHIIPNPQVALKEIKRVLKKDGVLIAPTYTRGMNKSSLRTILMSIFGLKTYSKWNDKEYKKFIEDNRFTVINMEMIFGNDYPECFIACKKKEI